ncbi:polysaccharide biosynthesis/export family protein [Cerasicoccus maritimus]|uniref:polysaccharide biosynthesis/export family protein n=1 Tax=Cerasicoccus maritimus TaxID=490089 RepID=UPI0028528E58|nr:polysaccharide biosynthesis/export family protein [Cerasicoccus maritimus]
MRYHLRWLQLTFLSLAFSALQAQSTDSGSGGQSAAGGSGETTTQIVLPANYKLNVTDTVEIRVFQEPELTVSQLIPANGKVRIPMLGEIDLLGLTIREAEYKIQEAFIDARLLRDPQVYVTVSGYVAREYSVFGQLGSQGQVPFPVERDSIDIVEAIARAGGFTGIARGSEVKVTRKKPDGTQEFFIVDVESMIEDQDEGNDKDEYLIYPGDIIYVPERLF